MVTWLWVKTNAPILEPVLVGIELYVHWGYDLVFDPWLTTSKWLTPVNPPNPCKGCYYLLLKFCSPILPTIQRIPKRGDSLTSSMMVLLGSYSTMELGLLAPEQHSSFEPRSSASRIVGKGNLQNWLLALGVSQNGKPPIQLGQPFLALWPDARGNP